MNFKKLISISFSTLGLACAISACSSDKVAGADEQVNTMATNSSSSMEPGSSSVQKPSDLDKAASKATMEMRAIFKENDDAPMFVLITNPSRGEITTIKETDNPKASFDEFVQSVASNDSVLWLDPLLGQFSCDSADCIGYTIALKDEKGVEYGPLYFEINGIYNSIRCLLTDDKTSERKAPFAYDLMFDDGYVFKYFYKEAADYGEDIPTLEQFKKDCEAENGEVEQYIYKNRLMDETGPSYAMSDTSAKCTITFADRDDPKWKKYTTDCNSETGHCERVAPPEDSLVVYKDPNWKKYVMALVNNCVDEVDP